MSTQKIATDDPTNAPAQRPQAGCIESIAPCLPQEKIDCARCEGRLNLGIFFDGTGNNRDAHVGEKLHSNVARLYAAYRNELEKGFGRVYIAGVGTPFPEVRDFEGSGGGPFGKVGEARILYGLLSIFNAVDGWLGGKKRVNLESGGFFTPTQMRALCSNSELKTTETRRATIHNIIAEDLAALKSLDSAAQRAGAEPLNMHQKGGLLHDWPGRNKWRHEFFKMQLDRIQQRIDQTSTPRLKEITIDVFGFSRGAAQARAFCNQLFTLTEAGGSKLFGVSFKLRFLGIFDTVASVGVQAGAIGYTTGHMAWADEAVAGGLSIHPKIHHCEHLAAMHENRGSFPLDRATAPGGGPMANGQEWFYPGAHSDVGGGYRPNDQGKSPTDADKLSQIPLAHMYNAARKAGVPLDKARAATLAPAPASSGDGGDGYDSFAQSPALLAAFKAFMGTQPAKGTTQQYLLPYLAWHVRHVDDYKTLGFYKNCKPEERRRIDKAQEQLRGDLARMRGITASPFAGLASAMWSYSLPGGLAAQGLDLVKTYLWIDRDAYERQQRVPALTPAEENLFANYVHDSLAGFVKDLVDALVEPTGRFHWRRVFYATDVTRVALAPETTHRPAAEVALA